MISINFEHNYQQKIMLQTFEPHSCITSVDDIKSWRSLWMKELQSWHSPYKVLVNLKELHIQDYDPALKEVMERMIKFFKGFFLKKIVGYPVQDQAMHDFLGFPCFATQKEAEQAIGLRVRGNSSASSEDFRALIQIENHFKQHTVEISFLKPVVIDSQEKLNVLKGKLTNNLMQWHSAWNLLIDCQNLEFGSQIHPLFQQMLHYFEGLFLKKVVGYQPKAAKESYPFPVWRARHKAAAQLEAEGLFSGADAHCRSSKV